MCLKPRIIINRHYIKIANNNKLGAVSMFGSAPDFYVKVDCGLCVECQKKRGNQWRQRLLDEYHYHLDKFPDSKVIFGTLTIANEYMHLFDTPPKMDKQMRLFLERYRKMFGCSFRHYITSEYGEKRGRLHFHFIGFRMLCTIQQLRTLWPFGRVDMQTLKGPQGLTYVSGYITKIVKGDKLTKESIPFFIEKDKKTKVWVSPAIGKDYCLDDVNRNSHVLHSRPVFVRLLHNNLPTALPRYYLDKLFSPIDLVNRKALFFKQMFELPLPPFKAHTRTFQNYVQYVDYVKSIGGSPLLVIPHHLLPKDIASSLVYAPSFHKDTTLKNKYESFIPNRDDFITKELYGK